MFFFASSLPSSSSIFAFEKMSHASIQALIRQHENLKDLIEKYPGQASSVCQTLLDLTYASRWQHLRLIDMQIEAKQDDDDNNSSTIICGLRPEAKGIEVVWCCAMSDTLQTAR
jgi:replication-associated recombination protein RarA